MSDDSMSSMSYPVMCYSKSTAPGIQTDKDVSFHRHDGYEFYLFLGGSVNFYVGDEVYTPARGDLFIIKPDVMHRAISRGLQQYDRFIINLRKDRIKDFFGGGNDLAHCYREDQPVSVRSVRLDPDSIEEYCLIAEKLSSAVYLRKPCDDLSREFYFNGKYISATFKKYTGTTLREYILDQRIMLAKRLLREGGNVSEACYHSGFLDYTNFIRSFTRCVGMSPGKYSRCARAGALGKQ